MPNMCNLIHNDYDRISDKVMWLGFGAVLNFNVDLFFQRKDNRTMMKNKENFHREFMYKNNPDEPYRVKIIRDFTYYFTIEYNTKEIKERVVIGPEQIYFFVFNLKKVMQWFIGENGINTIFSKRNDGTLFIPTHPESIKIDLAFGNYIEFEPAIDIVGGYETIGLKTYLNNDGIFFFMSSNTLYSLFHMVSTCNMYELAQNMLNYVGRPPYGTNSYNINTGAKNVPQTKFLNNSNNTISNKTSFFDRVGAKSEEIDP